MNTLYEKCIELIEQGRFEEASSHVREMRLVLDESSDNELGLLQRLLSVRISLKARGQDENEELPDPRGIDGLATWIAAEMAFVRGLCCYQRSDFQKGRGEFLFASTQYGNSGNIKRSLLSRYNALIGSFNLGEAAHNKAPDELVEEIRLLKREAMEAGDHKTLGLVARQYSLVLKDQGKFLAALAEAKKVWIF